MNDQTKPDAGVSPEAKERKKRYKQSLNLPQTAFAMKADLRQHEPASLARWNAAGLYERVLAARASDPPFVFHDGPPYANGAIHVGHLLNKVLKDMVTRSRNMAGQRCPYVPGWDCHGLPIEHRVMQELQSSGKAAKLESLNEDTRRIVVRRECAAYARKSKELRCSRCSPTWSHRASSTGTSSRCTGRSPTKPRSPRPSSSTTTARTRRSTCGSTPTTRPTWCSGSARRGWTRRSSTTRRS
jgi:hypothetical protein